MANKKGKRPREPRKRPGRPTLYKKSHIALVERLALLGATDEEMAEIIGISIQTLNLWKKTVPEFIEGLKRGRIIAESDVAASMYKKACGYSHRAVKIVVHAETGKTTVVPYTERFPPDTQAGIFILTNKRKGQWRSKVDVEHKIADGLAARLSAARKRVMKKTGKET